jgi:hypothetical protein
VIVVGLLVLLPILYVVSMRPAYRSLGQLDDSDAVVQREAQLNTFYGPVWWVAEKWPPLLDAALWWAGYGAPFEGFEKWR